MKRSVYKYTNFSGSYRAEFLYFLFNLPFLIAKIKIMEVYGNKYLPLDLLITMIYTSCWR